MSCVKPVKDQNHIFRNLSSAKISNSLAGSCTQLPLCTQCCSEVLAHQMQLAHIKNQTGHFFPMFEPPQHPRWVTSCSESSFQKQSSHKGAYLPADLQWEIST